jgi:hypothetical protein
MRDTWKGLVIGGLTGAAVGGVADVLRSRQLAEAVENMQQRAPRVAHDGVDALGSAARSMRERGARVLADHRAA